MLTGSHKPGCPHPESALYRLLFIYFKPCFVTMGVIIMALKTVAAYLASLGSTFVKRDSDGKTSVAVAPFVALGVGLSTLVCYFQDQEPFSACVRTVWTTIGGF